MTSSLKKEKEIVVFGGTGSIGSAIVEALYRQGNNVTAISRNKRAPLHEAAQSASQFRGPTIRYVKADVTKLSDLGSLHPIRRSEGIIYAVAHCPPMGFDDAITFPLYEVGSEQVIAEYQRHVIGLHNVIFAMIDSITPHGFICVIGSAITRLTDEQCPPWLHAGSYAAAKAAQHEYVKWLRRDPFIRKRNIRVHYIAPRAVDTPFHHGSPPEHQPPVLLPISVVVDEVLAAIDSDTVVDKTL